MGRTKYENSNKRLVRKKLNSGVIKGDQGGTGVALGGSEEKAYQPKKMNERGGVNHASSSV